LGEGIFGIAVRKGGEVRKWGGNGEEMGRKWGGNGEVKRGGG